MCANKTHIYLFIDEQHDSYYPIVITFYIEYVSVVTRAQRFLAPLRPILKPLQLGAWPQSCIESFQMAEQ